MNNKSGNQTTKHLVSLNDKNDRQYNFNKDPSTQALLTSALGIALYAGSLPAPIADTDNRNGWLYKKLASNTDKFNYYYYGEANNPLTLGNLKGVCANVSIDKWDSYLSTPFFVVYTKLTGSGDAGSWYHSKVAYAMDNSGDQDLVVGEHIEMWAKNKPISYSGLRQIEMKSTVITGDALDSEEIYTISLQSDSASPINTQMLVSSLGFDTVGSVNHRVKLISS